MDGGGAFPADPPAAAAPRAGAHDHLFLGASHAHHERRTRWVVALSLVVMVAELAGGWAFHSVALVADGLHMSTHAGALLVAAAAYAYARRVAHDPRFGWGAGKVGDLAAFASGVGLLLVAALIAWESVQRLLRPEPVAFLEAAAVAALGFLVSLASAILLRHDHGREHDHEHGSAHDRGRFHARDHNVWAAYLHMLADVITSVLTVGALLVGYATGWTGMDPLVGLLGAALVASFALALLRRAGGVLLDMRPDAALVEEARRRLQAEGDAVDDLHVWRVGPGHLALVAQVSTVSDRGAGDYHARLADLPGLSHLTVEVRRLQPEVGTQPLGSAAPAP